MRLREQKSSAATTEIRRLEALEDETARLKKLPAEAMLDNVMLKGIAAISV